MYIHIYIYKYIIFYMIFLFFLFLVVHWLCRIIRYLPEYFLIEESEDEINNRLLSKNLAIDVITFLTAVTFASRIVWHMFYLAQHVHTRDHVHYTTSNLARWHVAISSDKYSRVPSAYTVCTRGHNRDPNFTSNQHHKSLTLRRRCSLIKTFPREILILRRNWAWITFVKTFVKTEIRIHSSNTRINLKRFN